MERSDLLKLGVSGVVILAVFTAAEVRYNATLAAYAQHGDGGLPALPLGSTDSATIDAMQTEGSRFPRDPVIADYPSYDAGPLLAERGRTPATLIGTQARVCVRVPAERQTVVRSGEFVVGGYLPEITHRRRTKFFWRPVNSALGMRLLVRGRRLGVPTDTARFESVEMVAPLHSGTLEPYADEAVFPAGIELPSAGTWVVVATSGRNWGCFVIRVA
jgi:hypothetical protein